MEFFTTSSNFSLSRNGIYNILIEAICKIVKIPETHDLVVLSILLRPSVSTKNSSLSIMFLSHSLISKLFLFAISATVIGPYKSHPFVIVVCISLKGLNGPFKSKKFSAIVPFIIWFIFVLLPVLESPYIQIM